MKQSISRHPVAMRLLRNATTLILITVMSMIMSSCVHEWPEIPGTRPVRLTVHHELPWRLYEFNYREQTRGYGRGDTERPLEVRYIFAVYPHGETGAAVSRFELRRDDLTLADFTVDIDLPAGEYDVRVWSDFAEIGSETGLFYNATDFSNIKCHFPYVGDSEQKDAFQGMFTVDIPSVYDSEVAADYLLELRRPLTSYAFIADDLEGFITAEISRRELATKGTSDKVMSIEKAIRELDFTQYRAHFSYTGYLPTEYSIFRNRPVYSEAGISFDGNLRVLDDGEVLLGFDYFFINGTESSITVAVEIFDENGERVSYVPSLNIPVERGRATIVRGDFLTSKAKGGVGISSAFEGSFNIELP